ncbi:MAG: ROK family protein [Acidimicrobiales bacterium]
MTDAGVQATQVGQAGPGVQAAQVGQAGPVTLAIDIGGSGLKASVLDAAGTMLVDRVRAATTYPLPPPALVASLVELVRPLPAFDRVSAGFPGVVRMGHVVTAPHFVTAAGPGTDVRPDLVEAWTSYDLAGELATALGRPAKVVNDADLQGAAVIAGHGLELVITLGTGVGSGLFADGHLAPHMELAHHPFRKGQTYDEQIGDRARRRVGNKKWNKRVCKAFANFGILLNPDHVYIGGGNATHVSFDLGPGTTVVDNTAGILGGIKLWEQASPLA